MNIENLPVCCNGAITINENERLNLQTAGLQYYKVPGRYYHDYEHVYAMLDAHQRFFATEMSDALFLAVIMHDAVYAPGHSPDSENLSKALVPQMFFSALRRPITTELNDCVSALIHWTLPAYHVRDHRQKFEARYHNQAMRAQDYEVMTLLDLDLNGMSNPSWPGFIKTQYKIDREFEHLGSRPERCIKSAEFLKQFLDKGFVYYTPQMSHLNRMAIQNLSAYCYLVLKLRVFDFNAMNEYDPVNLSVQYHELGV